MASKKSIYYFLFILICASCSPCFGQSIEIKTDRNQILIGERIEYVLVVNLPSAGYTVDFNLPDTVPHFDVIEKNDFDTSGSGNALTLSKKIIFTSFDSGAWYIPSLPVTLRFNNASQNFATDSVLINVNYSPADTTNELRDIRPIIEIKVKDYSWLYAVALTLSVLLIILLLNNYIKNRKKKPAPVLHADISPYDQAMQGLNMLSQLDLNKPGIIKQYHTETAFILKRYYSRSTSRNLLSKTTDGLLLILKDDCTAGLLITDIAAALRISDAVKFAKYIPPVLESEQALAKIKNALTELEKNKATKK